MRIFHVSHLSHIALIALAFFIAAPAIATASVVVTIDKSTQRMKVEVDGSLRWIWPVSTGQLVYDTPSGRYTAFRMEADHFSKEWDDAAMPSSIFFSPKGHAIHGYLNTGRIGSPASHGCVRLEPANAARLYALVEQQGLPNTKVVVTGDVRVALARRGMPWGRGADESIGAGTALDGRSYAYWRRVDGYRLAPPRYPSAHPGYSYRHFGY
jgi:L,D-transpeptidase catalytic domain